MPGFFGHDFNNFAFQKNEVIQKYERRFTRLNEALMSDEPILFVRIYDNLDEKLVPIDYYNNILSRDDEDIQKWEDFITCIQNKYNKKTKLLVITSREDICNKTYNNVIMQFTTQHKKCDNIYEIIRDTIPLVI